MNKRDIKMDDALAEQCYVNPSDFDRKKYAALIRADEREECAQVCEDAKQEYDHIGHERELKYTCADAIRARSKYEK